MVPAERSAFAAIEQVLQQIASGALLVGAPQQEHTPEKRDPPGTE